VDRSLIRIAVAEYLGTFLLVFAGPGAVIIDAQSGGGVTPVGVGFSFGLAVLAAIVIFGSVSGAHINPAVTLAFASQKMLAWPLVPLYIVSQVAGAVSASAVHLALFDNVADLGATLPTGGAGQALGLEFVISFFLVLVIFSVATQRHMELSLAAVCIGAYVGLAATFAGPIAGASMNPARSFGPALVGGAWDGHWVYWLGPIAAALVAAFIFALLKPEAVAAREGELSESLTEETAANP
jgi:MIP family channel proteins